jgi:hypothetical protein
MMSIGPRIERPELRSEPWSGEGIRTLDINLGKGLGRVIFGASWA